MTSDDPPVIADLPFNYDKVYIQILLPEGASTGGANLVSLNNFMTNDASQWFEFDTAALTGQVGNNTGYIFNAYIGETYIPELKIDYKVFPAVNDSVDNGHFVSLACSTKSLESVFDQSQQDIQNKLQNNLSSSFEPFKFIKTYTGTFTCQFFGSIPMPGMWGRAVIPGGGTVRTIDAVTGDPVITVVPSTLEVPIVRDGVLIPANPGDMVVEGVIESVQFSYPGTVTVTVVQYAKINYSSFQIYLPGFTVLNLVTP